VARRIESDPIVLLAATRDGYSSGLANGELPEHRLSALDRRQQLSFSTGQQAGWRRSSAFEFCAKRRRTRWR
jgi:hypothetical protein